MTGACASKMTLHRFVCLQLFESVEEIRPPASPGSRAPDPVPAYDALRVARETAEEVSSMNRASSKGSPTHPSHPSHSFAPSRVTSDANINDFAIRHPSENKLNELTFKKLSFQNVAEVDHDSSQSAENGSSEPMTYRRADSVASCASEWVKPRDAARVEALRAEAEACVSESAPAGVGIWHQRKQSQEARDLGKAKQKQASPLGSQMSR